LLPLISRPHPGPAAAAGGLARRGCSPRALCYPDPRARLLQARRGSWPGGGPAAARRTDGPAAVRRPVAAYSLPLGGRGGGGAADSAADCPPNRRASRRQVRPEAAPIPPKPPLLSARSRTAPIELCVRPAAALVVTCAQAQLIMLPAVLHLPLFKHHTLPLFCTRLTMHSLCPHMLPSAILWPLFARGMTHFVIYRTLQVAQSADYPLLLLSALVQLSELCPPSPPAVPVLLDVFSAERGAYLGSADFLHALPRPGRATRSSTLEPSPAGAGTFPP